MYYGHNEAGYLGALDYIMRNGTVKTDRTGTGTRSVFGQINLEFDLMDDGGAPILPLLTTKKIFHRSFIHELIWMLSGSSDVAYLKANNVSIWDSWVIPSTAKYRMLEWGERIRKMTPGQLEKFSEIKQYLTDEGFNESEILNRLEMSLNNWSIPEEELVSGDLGPVYGAQWRRTEDIREIHPSEIYNEGAWEKYGKRGFVHAGQLDNGNLIIKREIDQIAELEDQIRNKQDSRRIILSAWNVARIDEMALPPCHTLAQWAVEDGMLHCKLYQRSGDFFIGVPFNFGFYALMTHMLAQLHGLRAGKLFHTFGDAHIYSNHEDQVREQLSREELEEGQAFLQLNTMNGDKSYESITEFKFEDIQILGYQSHDAIKAAVAV